MNERRERGGHSVLPFLLIPATVMMVKAMHRHRAMRAHGWGAGAYGFGHHGWAGRAGGPEGPTGTDGKPEFRLPPRIESFLNAWHEQAHQAGSTGESSEAPSA